MANLRWLRPGLGLKRWVALIVFGLLTAICGSIILGLRFFGALETGTDFLILPYYAVGGALVLGGSGAILAGVYRIVKQIEKILKHHHDNRTLTEIAIAQSSQGAKIVCIGGGTGLNCLLSGLRRHSSQLTAVVSVADDGGSSGRLRNEFGMLPPGDIRNCLSALADSGDMMSALMQYRFADGELAGHAFGNLLIMVLTKIRGNFAAAVRDANRILNVRGQVLPVSLDQVTLVAEHPDGTKTTGQKNIAQCGKKIVGLTLKPTPGLPPDDVIEQISQADAIVIGPGSLYTSIIPNLLIPEVTAAITRSSAKVFYVVNTMAQPGETAGFKVSDYLQALRFHAPGLRIDAAIVNSTRPSGRKLAQLANDKKIFTEHFGMPGVPFVNADAEDLPGAKKIADPETRLLFRDVINLANPEKHDPDKLARAIIDAI